MDLPETLPTAPETEPKLPNAMRPHPIAAVDLGSNSFHMIVAEIRANEVVILDRLREMVRLGQGLTPEMDLTIEAQQRALDCLERFGERLRKFPAASVRVVGTNTLRAARNAEPWLEKAVELLGHPIEIISGIEEARLIYQGVSNSLPCDGQTRLVMDIGGGSTEYILGIDHTPLQKESLRMGCVSMSMAHFPEGKINAKRFKKAVVAAEQELEPIQHLYQKGQWKTAIGASGTLKAAQKILVERGWSREGITPEGLESLIDFSLSTPRLTPHDLPELNPDRFPSFFGGLAIIKATFNLLRIEKMVVSEGALREGLLIDLMGRINHEDVRDRTVQAMAFRYHVEMEHARLIQSTSRRLFDQFNLPCCPDREKAGQWLEWASLLHDIGRDIAHSGYHKHGAYILANADLPGFSQTDQQILAMLVRSHRRKFPIRLIKDLSAPNDDIVRWLSVLLRLSVLVHRSRSLTVSPQMHLKIENQNIHLSFPSGWLEQHPLTEADLEQETGHLEAAGLKLIFS